VNTVFIYYKNRAKLSSTEMENNNSDEAYKKLLVELNKIKNQQKEKEKNKKENKKGLNLTEIRDSINNSSNAILENLDHLGYLDNDDGNPFWYEY
jgi:predicted transcriptional regulator